MGYNLAQGAVEKHTYWVLFMNRLDHDDIARTTGEKRGVTRFTKGRLLGSTHNHDSSSSCFKNPVDNRKTGSVARIATESSLAVNDRANHPSLPSTHSEHLKPRHSGFPT